MSGKFIITGLNGKRALSGSVAVKGAKNAALKALAASLLFDDTIYLSNVPDIEDVKRMVDMLSKIGVRVSRENDGEYQLSAPDSLNTVMPTELAQKMRASIVLTGPVLARYGAVSFPHPGGCVIGERPIDLFLSGFEHMGASVERDNDRYVLTVPAGGKLRGATIFFKKPSVTATETLMMAAILAEGETVIKNAAREPEILSLSDFLNECGANISGAGESEIHIIGGGLLHSSGNRFYTPPDRIETGSFLILGALAGKRVEIKNCNPAHIELLIHMLRDAGVSLDIAEDSIVVRGEENTRAYASFDIETREYPGFPTDLQAPIAVFLTQARGQSRIFETIFEGRLSYAEELVRMGANIEVCDPHRIIINGPSLLRGREMESPDLRAGLAFVIAAIVAQGTSVVHNIYNIDRGYERIEERLQKIGVDITRVTK